MTKKAAGGMSVFVVTDVADEKVANILDEKFNMSTTMPDNPKSDYYNSSSARIIDEYKLTSNNCTTMVSDVLNKSGSNALKETNKQFWNMDYYSYCQQIYSSNINAESFSENIQTRRCSL